MLLAVFKFLFISAGLIYLSLFLYGLICVILNNEKGTLKQYLIFAPSLVWIFPLAVIRILYRMITENANKNKNR